MARERCVRARQFVLWRRRVQWSSSRAYVVDWMLRWVREGRLSVAESGRWSGSVRVPGRSGVLGLGCVLRVRERRLGALMRASLRRWNCEGVSVAVVSMHGTEQVRPWSWGEARSGSSKDWTVAKSCALGWCLESESRTSLERGL